MARILLVDDDAQIRSGFRMILERAGYEIQEAEDGNAALRQFAQCPADLVITDIVMPDKDGLEVVMALRRTAPGVKILAISGGGRLSSVTYLDIADSLGADAVVAKPVNRDTLLKTVASLLERTDCLPKVP